MDIIPGEEKLALIQDKAKDRTEAGLEIPTDARRPPNTGVIVAVGQASALEPARMAPFKEGDRVAFDEFAGTGLVIDGQPILFINALDVLAIIPGGSTVQKVVEK